MTTQNKNVPALRFTEFVSDWDEKKLEDISFWASGGTPSKDNALFWNGDIPWISASSMRGIEYSDSELKLTQDGLKNGSRLAEKGSLLILVRGSMLFKTIPVGIVSRDVAFNQDVKSIKCNDETTSIYILYWLLSLENKLLNMVVGTGIGAGKLELSDLKQLPINLPTFPEQQKIAAFLTAVDEKIQQLAKKKDLLEQYKKGVMQKIFNQEIRFKDDNGNDFADWELTELKEIAVRVKDKNKSNEINKVLTNSATRGIVSQQDYFDKDIANQNNLEGYYIVEKDDFVYNPRISASAPVGPIKRNNLEKGLMSPLYSVFRFNDVNLDFIEQFFETSLWHDYLKSIANYGARHDRMNITVEGFFAMPILLPIKPEQQKIADFLSAIDDKVNLVNQQLDKTKEFKKGLLQQMFV